MKEIYKYMGFIIGFLVLVLIVQNFFGNKGSEKFVLLVLFTMVVLNAGKFGDFMKDKFSIKED